MFVTFKWGETRFYVWPKLAKNQSIQTVVTNKIESMLYNHATVKKTRLISLHQETTFGRPLIKSYPDIFLWTCLCRSGYWNICACLWHILYLYCRSRFCTLIFCTPASFDTIFVWYICIICFILDDAWSFVDKS